MTRNMIICCTPNKAAECRYSCINARKFSSSTANSIWNNTILEPVVVFVFFDQWTSRITLKLNFSSERNCGFISKVVRISVFHIRSRVRFQRPAGHWKTLIFIINFTWHASSPASPAQIWIFFCIDWCSLHFWALTKGTSACFNLLLTLPFSVNLLLT
jgi:hypothetical protein